MLILALDTTGSARSCALARDGVLVREEAGDATHPQATRLPGELAALLDRERVGLGDIDAFAVGVGPGSFTGMRVGIATMQGLAVATDRPLFGVSALDALAYRAGLFESQRSAAGLRVAAWVDAWRGEVYAALYEPGRGPAPTSASPGRLLDELRDRPTLFTGGGAAVYQETIRAALGPSARFTDPIVPLLAGAMAQMAAGHFRAGHRPAPDAVRPLYVRRSDAELTRDRT
ncbi:MAG: tRNA (adenosine(37)-N6)-threonylcarbamoyltransferase complex dimerization subunit type 1 TsaB [Acidobacteria bacterium RIFCSPLOWO2_02_FULL_67_21]|nr:MAG: tRNA (adenosine(37)-N6)-threonylcarbamoyltransferase complex dimerization subunit type 1 TsaB [Acidobacteria bacterium RIFCSPLOWO2_02_FULL_67_21]